MRVAFRQALGNPVPSAARIARAEHGKFAFGTGAKFGAGDWNHPGGVTITRMHAHAESESRRNALRNVRPAFTGRIAAIDSAMVLLVETLTIRGTQQFVNA